MTSSQMDAPKYVAPNACAHCNWLQTSHGICYSKELKALHTYVAPSNELRLQRMKTNREYGLKG